MPIYEYSCGKCGDVIERIQKFSDPPLKKHPGCGGSLTKLISQSAFQLKGEGWYVTDYAKSGAKPEKAPAEDSPAPDKNAPADKPDTGGSAADKADKADKKTTTGQTREKSGSRE